MAAVAATILSGNDNDSCPAGALLCEGGPNCTHRSPKSPLSPRSPKKSPRRSPRSKQQFSDSVERSPGDNGVLAMGPSLNYLVDADEPRNGADELEDGGAEADHEVIQELYHKVKKSKEHVDNYIALLGFILLTMLYLIILYLQADSFKTFEVSTAHMSLLPDGLTGEGGFTFSSIADIYTWLNDSIVQEVWADSNCGNGICERPDEFQAFGRFGCLSDCGKSSNLSQVIISFNLSFTSTDDMSLSNWNLCLLYPTAWCWYEEAVTFDSLLGTNTTSLDIPDGNWTLVVNAPSGGVVGSVVYNSTYAWQTPDKIPTGSTLVKWANCAANESATAFEICKQTAGALKICAQERCSAKNVSLTTEAASTGFFVDLVGMCNSDSTALDQFIGLDCDEAAYALDANQTSGFVSIRCTTASGQPISAPPLAPPVSPPSGSRRLQDTSLWGLGSEFVFSAAELDERASKAAEPERRITLAELNTDPYDFTDSLWNFLGATQAQRLYNLRAATQRALYTWAGHSCLASTPLPVNIVDRLSAFFCTYFGGPNYLDGCIYVGSLTNETVTSDSVIAAEMRAAHAGLAITREQQEAFVGVFLLALKSVLTLDESTVVAFNSRLHALDTEIVNTTETGCPYVASVLPWTVGQNLNSEISIGDSVTWVWEDDEPHSIRMADGLGDGADSFFQGMGTGRLIVSQNSACTPDNIGPGNMSGDPMPCVLRTSDSAMFTYTKTFTEAGVYSYVDGRNEGTSGVVSVVNGSFVSQLSIGSLATTCAPGCTLGVVRNGICNVACNNRECAFDGGDCSCSPNQFGISTCSCPDGQTKSSDDGHCCEAFGVGSNLNFGFTVLTWGPNSTITDTNFLPRDGPPLFRYIANHNRVLVGMTIQQKRWASKECRAGRFKGLFPNCTYGASTANYGVNPVFLPKSVLYNAQYAANDTAYYANYSLGFDDATLRNKQGIPFGFNAFAHRVKPTFHYILDINLNNEQAEESLQYMQDGFFMDNATKEVSVQLITYNGVEHKFTLFEVLLTFQEGGKIPATYNIQSINAEPYRSGLDWFRFSLEILFVCCVLWNIFEEMKELIVTVKQEGSILAHFSHLWNVVDFISLGIMISGIILWTNFVITQARPFRISLRYDIYDLVSWQSSEQYWDIVKPGDDFKAAIDAFNRVEAMVFFRTYYIALQGINVLLMVLRILKLMDFQPRMGTITRTVAAAAPDLVHFFILFFVVFFGFAMYGHLVFGRTLDQFRTLPVALVTCFSAMLGNDSVNDYLMQLHGWELLAAVIFWWSYILIMVFIIFNLLIAIVVEAFMKVREDMEEAPSMPSEVLYIVQHMSKRLFTPLRTDKELLRHLRALGADKTVPYAKNGQSLEDSMGGSKRTVVMDEPPPTPQSVIRVDDQELDADTLHAILERSNRRKVESKVRLKQQVDPKIIADVVFDQFREHALPPEEAPTSDSKELLDNVERMKSDVGEMKDMIRGMVQAMAAIQGQVVPHRA